MNQIVKKLTAFVLVPVLCLGLWTDTVPAAASGAEAEAQIVSDVEAVSDADENADTNSGTCGDDLTWELSEEGVLTISGTGSMESWSGSNSTPWSSLQGDIVSVVIGEGVTVISDMSFMSCKNLVSVTIASSVTEIGSLAFSGCSALTGVEVPAGVTSIGNNAFADCEALTAVSVDVNNTAYASENGALYNKNKTTLLCVPAGKSGNFTIPSGVTYINRYALNKCNLLTDITIPDSVTGIDSYAFYKCVNLTEVKLSAGVKSIGSHVFDGCTGLISITVSEDNTAYSSIEGAVYNKAGTSLICVPEGKTGCFTIPSGVTYIGDYAFYNCARLTGVVIPDSVVSIGGSAFYHCDGLTEINIPDSVTYIGTWAFASCKALADVRISAGLTKLPDSVFSGCSALETVEIPVGITVIDNRAFAYCSALREITIPAGVTAIGIYTFSGCTALPQITIPAGVTSVGNYAFSNCTNLDEVVFTGTAPSFESSSFYKVTAAAYYPQEDTTWNVDVRQDYGGTLEWIPYTDLDAAKKKQNTILDTVVADGTTCTLPDNYINYTTTGTCLRQYACKEAGGVYFLQGSKLKFLNLSTGLSSTMYTFPSASTYVYQTDNILYWASGGTVIAYDLVQGRVDHTLKLDGVTDSYGIGVDAQGRIYLSVQENSVYYLRLYSAQGQLLDQIENERVIYEFSGFAKTGEVFFVAYYKWIYWGYEHDMYTLFAAKVSGNQFCEVTEGYKIGRMWNECQMRYYQHQDNASVLNQSVLTDKDGRVYDVSEGMDGLKSLLVVTREYDETLTNTSYDTLSIGTRMLYDADRGTLLAYTSGKMIWEYDLSTGASLRCYETQHYVFNLLEYGDSIIAVEKENGVYYIEQFGKSDMQYMSSAVIDLNETDTYSSHTQEAVKSRWEEAFITSDTQVYASEASISPYTPAVFTDDMKKGLLEYSNYLRWLGGLTGFEASEDEIWDNAGKGTVLLTKLNELTHSPSQPEDMDDEFYEAAYKGCSESNLYGGGTDTPAGAMSRMTGWMNDTENVSSYQLGHRFTFLQRAGYRIAYGSTRSYMAQTVEDYQSQANKTGTISGVDNNDYCYTWPGAGYFPTNAINTSALWSINLNSDRIDLSNTGMTVTIEDLDTGKVYDQTSSIGSSAYYGFSAYFGYFYGECFYFDPPDADSYAGKNYRVTVGNLQLTNGQPAEIVYTVHFCTLEHSWDEGVVTKAPTTSETGIRTCTCEECGEKKTETIAKLSQTDISGFTASLSESSFVYDGTAKEPSVAVTNGSVTLSKGTDYTVSYSNNTNAGTAVVTISGKGDYKGTITKNFTIAKASQTVTAGISPTQIKVGETALISAQGKGTLDYSSGSSGIASVNSSGKVTGIAAGTAVITVTASGDSNYKAGSCTVTVTVTKEPETEKPTEGETEKPAEDGTEKPSESETEAEKISLSRCTVTLSDTVFTYTGKAIKPGVTVKYGSVTLTLNDDYAVSYEKNINAGTDTAVVIVTGKGDYTGTVRKAFTIKKASNSITASNITKNASATKTQTFSLGAKAKGGKLSYQSNNTKITVNSSGQVTIAKNYAGTAKITITAGDSNYQTVTKTITVTAKQIANTITASSFTKTYSTKNQTFSIGAKRKGSGKVTYVSSSKSVTVSSTGKVTVKAKYMGKATITIKVAASGIYKAASKKITVTVNPTKTTLSGVTNAKGLKMTVKWKKNTVGTGYQIQYTTDKNFKTGVKTVTVKKNSTVSTTVSKLTKGKTYYVRIRTYRTVSGKNYYSGWSTAKSVKIAK